MLRQLDERTGDGVVVELLWDEDAGPDFAAVVKYRDRQRSVSYTLRVPASRALDAFHHPNAYCDDAITGIPEVAAAR